MKAEFKKNSAGIRKLLTSAKGQQAVTSAANGLAARAGNGFGVHSSTTSRARAYVRAETLRARRKQRRDHVLERVMGGGL